MSNLGEQIGTLIGQDESLMAEHQAMIHVFVGMVRRGEIQKTLRSTVFLLVFQLTS
jgi:hypothetical protein